jgi:hypothetical protein
MPVVKESKTKRFAVTARINLEVAVDISAADLDDAMAQAKALKVEDFVEVGGDLYDHCLRITQLYEHHTNVGRGLTE